MAQVATLNQFIPKQENYVFDWEFVEDDEITPIDVSTWSFQFIMKSNVFATIWNIQNADFSRPSTSRISFTKSVGQMTDLAGLYTISLLVTKTATIDEEFVSGYFEF